MTENHTDNPTSIQPLCDPSQLKGCLMGCCRFHARARAGTESALRKQSRKTSATAFSSGVSCRARDHAPIVGIGVHLGKALSAGKDQQVVEVGEDPRLGTRPSLRVRRVAGQMVALSAAMNQDPGLRKDVLDRTAVYLRESPTASGKDVALFLGVSESQGKTTNGKRWNSYNSACKATFALHHEAGFANSTEGRNPERNCAILPAKQTTKRRQHKSESAKEIGKSGAAPPLPSQPTRRLHIGESAPEMIAGMVWVARLLFGPRPEWYPPEQRQNTAPSHKDVTQIGE